MPATPMLTLSQFEALDTAYLRNAADFWEHTANVWEESFTEVHRPAVSSRWHGLDRCWKPGRAGSLLCGHGESPRPSG